MPINMNSFMGSFDAFARPTLFHVILANTRISSAGGNSIMFHCRAAQMPAMTLGTIEAPFMGRKAKLKGDRTYDTWTCTLMVDNKFVAYRELVKWQEQMNGAQTNAGDYQREAETMIDAEVWMLNHQGKKIQGCKLVSCWIKEIGAIELDWSNNDTIAEVALQFEYQWSEPLTENGIPVYTSTVDGIGDINLNI